MTRLRTNDSPVEATARRKAAAAAAARHAVEQRVAAEQAIDATVRREVASAQQAISRAMSACRGAKVGREGSAGRLSRVVRDLGRAHHALANVGTVFNPYAEDMTEEERSAKFWADRAAEDAAQREAAQAAQAALLDDEEGE